MRYFVARKIYTCMYIYDAVRYQFVQNGFPDTAAYSYFCARTDHTMDPFYRAQLDVKNFDRISGSWWCWVDDNFLIRILVLCHIL